MSSIESTSDKFSSLFFRFEAVDGTIERDNRWVEDCWTSVDERETERRARVSSSVMGVRLPLWMEGTVVPSVWSISPRFSRDPLFPDKRNFLNFCISSGLEKKKRGKNQKSILSKINRNLYFSHLHSNSLSLYSYITLIKKPAQNI